MEYRIEHDSMGEVKVPADKYWGAQTQRSLENFKISTEKMPSEIIHALALLKYACALVNNKLKPTKMTEEKLGFIDTACHEIMNGTLNDHFPLSVWQTGSGTQTNMNVNEVIANRGNALAGKKLLHPNDDANMSQSSNDTFPTAMHIAAVLAVENKLLPSVEELASAFKTLEVENEGVVKSGRTHLQDATPISFSQEISGWRASLEISLDAIRSALVPVKSLAIGATAVGTGLNAPDGFDRGVCDEVSKATGIDFAPVSNKFHALSSKSELVFLHGAIKSLACNLMKIANDIRWLSSGPRCGLGEITIPENEPGSSIMPGKVNPTQCEAMTMACVQVMANDQAVSMSAFQGNFQLNVFMPVLIHNLLQSVRLLADASVSIKDNCVVGIKANREKMHSNLHNSLMLVTALTPYIGYEKGAEIAKLAHKEGVSLKEACLKLNYLTEKEFDEYFHPEKMI